MENKRVSDEITEIIVASIAKLKELSPEAIKPDSSFEDLKMDSLDGLDLFFELEEKFDLTITDERARSLRTVRDIVNEIEKLQSERNAGSPVRS
jgi:acyl carrier protein